MKNPRVPVVQVAAAVIEYRGRYLISRRRSGGHLGGCWEFPGGKRRPGEPWTACLRRELMEELGVAVEPAARLASIRYRYPDRVVRLEVFRCRLRSGTPRPLAVQAVRWAAPAQLRRLRFPPADRPLIEQLALLSRTGKGAIIRTKVR